MQAGGDAHRQARRAVSRDLLKQQLHKTQLRFQHTEHKGAHKHYHGPQQRNGCGFIQAFFGQAALERPQPALGKDDAHFLHQHKKGGGLDAAARRPGRSADEH